MNTEFKKFFGFAKRFEFQKISNDYTNTKTYKKTTFTTFIIFGTAGVLAIHFVFYFNDYFKNLASSLNYRRKMFNYTIRFKLCQSQISKENPDNLFQEMIEFSLKETSSAQSGNIVPFHYTLKWIRRYVYSKKHLLTSKEVKNIMKFFSSLNSNNSNLSEYSDILNYIIDRTNTLDDEQKSFLISIYRNYSKNYETLLLSHPFDFYLLMKVLKLLSEHNSEEALQLHTSMKTHLDNSPEIIRPF